MTRIALLGPSDGGIHLGINLNEAGAEVIGYNLPPAEYSPIRMAASLEQAVEGTDLVLSFELPQLAEKTAQQCASLLKEGALFADFSSGTPDHKKHIAAVFSGAVYADVALTRAGTIETAGPAAQPLTDVLSSLGVKVSVVSDVSGDVAARTLVRTLLVNGLAEVLADTLWAAESLGIEDWAWSDIKEELIAMDGDTAQEFIDDTAYNFKRHQIAMQDVVEMLTSSGYDSTMIAPIQFTHGRIMHGKKIPHSQVPAKKWQR
jgi:3-hydroxyisobutyrate dehydrogenase-like beta-hydroxyacid dehydrogenase